ncbi:MAG: trigger factor [Patescibacteria group bacterium]
MQVEQSERVRGQLVLTITVSVAETEPYLDRASRALSQRSSVAGFRPGKAPRNVVAKHFGEMALYEAALQDIFRQTFWQALKEKNIESVGSPDIAVEKIAPGNPVVYRATVSVMPVVQLGAWKDIRISRQTKEVSQLAVDKVVDDLLNMQASEALVDRAARAGDKVEVDFEVRREGAVIEGGSGKKFPLILGGSTMIPGFEEQITGMKAGEKKDFRLTFPKPYFQEKLAGAECDFSVSVIALYERILPEKNDEWAQKVIGKAYTELLSMVRGNLQQEQDDTERRRLEQELVQKIIERSTFEDIPEKLLTAEVESMLHELRDDIRGRGMEWDKYLQNIKKNEDDLKKDFGPRADTRVKGALVMRTLARDLAVSVGDADLDEELERQREQYGKDNEALSRINSKEYRHYLGIMLANRKVMGALVSACVS